jgi:hypothetical protein
MRALSRAVLSGANGHASRRCRARRRRTPSIALPKSVRSLSLLSLARRVRRNDAPARGVARKNAKVHDQAERLRLTGTTIGTASAEARRIG